jgi:putative two-component system response regulator
MTYQSEKVLVVDDDESIRELVGRMLERDGYLHKTAASAEEALEILQEEEIALVISDINMPGKTGIDLLREVKDSYKDIAVMMATAVDDRNVAIQSLYMGAFGYVTKPFNKNELMINVTNALRRRELEIENRRHSEELESTVSLRTAELQQSREETIHKLARAAEFRDNETAQHTVRVGNFCEILAQSAGQDDVFCKELRIAAQLHDVGKIGISDTILLKPGKLTASEFEEIKKHCEIGYRILEDSKSEVLNLGAVIALTHHEKFNGSGYPKGLSQQDIPLVGRITAICDVFDALTSHRVYKAAMPVEQALEILKKEREEHFDPEILDLFLSNLEKIIIVKEQYKDSHTSTLDGDNE